ncbi:MAG: rRNA maturation RNase YbeY [Ekhidna sp.]
MRVNYFCEDVEFQIINEQSLSQWVLRVIQMHSFELDEINYIFCSDEYLLKINKEHLNHDYYTDIITFDNSEKEKVIESDIFISIDRVKENADSQTGSFDKELHRVMIHGVLHLVGFSDKTSSDQKLMREKEDACLSLLKI